MLNAYRVERRRALDPERLPLALSVTMGAVILLLPDVELCLSPEQAAELARELLRLGAESERLGRLARGEPSEPPSDDIPSP